jgi:hypothetical protein
VVQLQIGVIVRRLGHGESGVPRPAGLRRREITARFWRHLHWDNVTFRVTIEPFELFVTKVAETAGLEIDDIDQAKSGRRGTAIDGSLLSARTIRPTKGSHHRGASSGGLMCRNETSNATS